MENYEEKPPGVPMWGALFVTMIFGLFTSILVWGLTDMHWRSECVKRGLAHWKVTNDAGRTEFEWNSK